MLGTIDEDDEGRIVTAFRSDRRQDATPLRDSLPGTA
jgi:hypothetical protein